MANVDQINAESTADFNLKHRITGAAVLIFFGVLVLPWMLGPPSGSDSTQDAQAGTESAPLRVPDNSDPNPLIPDTGFEDEPEETVYISKITPLDQQKADQQKANRSEQTDSQESSKQAQQASKPATPQPKQEQPETSVSATPTTVPAQDKKSTPSVASSGSVAANTPASTGPRESTSANSSSNAKPASKSVSKSSSPAEPTKPSSSVDVGWVVQVGLFSTTGYQLRATKLVNELNRQGFDAGSTIVDTNRGKGMRVWLGPFTKRADASNEVQRLKTKTGKDGFVRVYP